MTSVSGFLEDVVKRTETGLVLARAIGDSVVEMHDPAMLLELNIQSDVTKTLELHGFSPVIVSSLKALILLEPDEVVSHVRSIAHVASVIEARQQRIAMAKSREIRRVRMISIMSLISMLVSCSVFSSFRGFLGETQDRLHQFLPLIFLGSIQMITMLLFSSKTRVKTLVLLPSLLGLMSVIVSISVS